MTWMGCFMEMRLFNCPLDGRCISPPGVTDGRKEKGRNVRCGPRVCTHFRADGTAVYCSYARERIPYEEEGPLPAPGPKRKPSPPSPGAGFWTDSYVSRRSRRKTRAVTHGERKEEQVHYIPVPSEGELLAGEGSL